jgi:hypothetical protein
MELIPYHSEGNFAVKTFSTLTTVSNIAATDIAGKGMAGRNKKRFEIQSAPFFVSYLLNPNAK